MQDLENPERKHSAKMEFLEKTSPKIIVKMYRI